MDGLLEKLDDLKKAPHSKGEIYKSISSLVTEMKSHPKPSTSSKNSGAGASAAVVNKSPTSSAGSARQRRRIEEGMMKMEAGLKELEKEIEQRSQQELSMDDLDNENSAFTILESLKRKHLRIVNSLTKLRNESLSAALSPSSYSGSGYEAIDKAVTKLIRPRVSAKQQKQGGLKNTPIRALDLPNFADLTTVIRKTNESEKLGLSEQEILELVKKVATEVTDIAKARDRQILYECLPHPSEAGTSGMNLIFNC